MDITEVLWTFQYTKNDALLLKISGPNWQVEILKIYFFFLIYSSPQPHNLGVKSKVARIGGGQVHNQIKYSFKLFF